MRTPRSYYRVASLALLVLFAARHVSAAGALPERFTARYLVRSHGMTVGMTEWRLAPSGPGRYRYDSRREPRGILALLRGDVIVEHSEGRREPDDALRPLHYRYERSGGKKDRKLSIDFAWDTATAHIVARGDRWRLALPEGTLDKLIYVLAIMRDLARGRADLTYTIADGGKLKHYVFRRDGGERIETALGTLQTVRLQRVHQIKTARTTTLWFAPSLHFLPVRIDHRDKKGTRVILDIESLTGIARPEPSNAAATNGESD